MIVSFHQFSLLDEHTERAVWARLNTDLLALLLTPELNVLPISMLETPKDSCLLPKYFYSS